MMHNILSIKIGRLYIIDIFLPIISFFTLIVFFSISKSFFIACSISMILIIMHEFSKNPYRNRIYFCGFVVLCANLLIIMYLPIPDRINGNLAYGQIIILEGLLIYLVIKHLAGKKD